MAAPKHVPRIAFASWMLACAAAAGACIDLTPVTVTAVEADGGADAQATVDAGDAGSDVDTRTPCVRCFEGADENDAGACDSRRDACFADPICLADYRCIVASGCLELATTNDVVGCALPCSQEAGLRSQFDPAADEILTWFQCGQRACRGKCNWTQ